MIPGCAPQPTAKRDKGSLGQSRRRVDVFCDQDAWTSLISPLNLWAHNLSSSTPEIFQHFSRKRMWTSQQADKAVDWSVYEAKTMNLTCNVFTVWRLETTTTNNFTLCPVVLEHLCKRRPTIQTEISQQLMDELQYNLVQTFMILRGLILLVLMILLLFHWCHHEFDTFNI